MTCCYKPEKVQSSLEKLRVQKDQEESRVEVRVRSDVKGQGFLMVYTWYTHVQRRLKSMTSRYIDTVIAQECGQTLGLGLGQSKDIVVVFYQSIMDKGLGDRHMTWKSCDRVQSGLEGLRVQKDREESRVRVRVRSDVKGQGFLMVHT